MTIARIFVVCLCVAGLAPAHAAPASVKVTFIHPERFNDQEFRVDFTPAQRAAALQLLSRHIERAGAAILSPGQALRLEIFDMRRAGNERPFRGGEVRVFTAVTPPTIALRYQLSGGGRPAQSGTTTLSDMRYLQNPTPGFRSDRYTYEKALIDDWLRQIAVK